MEKDVKELVLWRLDSVPPNLKLSVGNKGTFSKEELKKHIEDEDEVGQLYAEIQMSFIKALASGNFSRALAQ